jgi:hypothetical protein
VGASSKQCPDEEKSPFAVTYIEPAQTFGSLKETGMVRVRTGAFTGLDMVRFLDSESTPKPVSEIKADGRKLYPTASRRSTPS